MPIPTNAVLTTTHGFIIIPLQHGVVIEGASKAQIITGPGAVAILPQLLQYLNGSHTAQQIVIAEPRLPSRDVYEVLNTLFDWGVLCTTTGTHQRGLVSTAVQETLAALRRRDAVGANTSTADLLHKQWLVLVSDENSEEICLVVFRLLRENGFTNVSRARIEHLAHVDDPLSLFISIASSSQLAARSGYYNALLLQRNTWIRILYNAEQAFAEIGPAFKHDTDLSTAHLSSQTAQPAVTFGGLGTAITILGSMLATELTAQLISTMGISCRSVRRYNIHELTTHSYTWPLRHLDVEERGGKLCSSHSESDLVFRAAVEYEELVTRRQEQLSAYSEPDLFRIAPTNRLLSAEAVSLPKDLLSLDSNIFKVLNSHQQQSSASPNIAQLSAILRYGLGLKTDECDTKGRWAASAGNLGSCRAFVAIRNVISIPDGVYLYREEHHDLARLTRHSERQLEEAVSATETNLTAGVLLFLVGEYSRVHRKYGPFAYKLMYLDSGYTGSQVMLIAQALCVDCHEVRSWQPRRVERALALRCGVEIPTQVYRIGIASDHASSISDCDDLRPVPSNLNCEIPEECESIQRLLAGENLVVGRVRSPVPAKRSWLYTSLNWKRARGMSLQQALSRRRSVRQFSAGQVTEQQLMTILREACEGHTLGLDMKIKLNVCRVHGLQPAWYLYDANAHSKLRLGIEMSEEQWRRSLLGADIENAAVFIWISARMSPRSGIESPSYQSLLFQGGYLGHRIWMASVGLNLSGVILAGVTSEATWKEHVWAEGGEFPLFTFACGTSPITPFQESLHAR